MKRCGECGSTNIERKNVKGKTFVHKGYDKLELKKDVYLPVCNDCDNVMLFPGDAHALTIGLNESESDDN